jgi:ATP-dependent helicase/nuclease subunit A
LIRESVKEIPPDVPGLERVSGWEENLIAAVEDIAFLRASFAQDPVDLFVEKLRARSLFEVSESARFLGAWRCANLDRFFREITDALCEGQSVHDLLQELRDAVDSEKQAEESRPMEEVSDAVQLMTIHAAKGLDFDHVYLMQLHKGSAGRGEPDTGVAQRGLGFEYRLFGAPSLAWDLVQQQSVRVSEAEQVRLLYVAMTRAKQRVVLSGLWKDFQKQSRSGQAVELLNQRIESTDGLRDWIGTTGKAPAANFLDTFGSRWRLPALEASAEVENPRTTHPGAQLPEASEIAASSKRLAALREQAAQRMHRPISSTASAQAHQEWEAPKGSRPKTSSTPLSNAASLALGTAIHRVFEEYDFDSEPESELQRQLDSLHRDLSLSAPSGEREATLAAGSQLLNRIATGKLFAQLRSLSDQIVAKELPVLLPPSDDEGAIGFLVGAIDLVYRDPSSDELVIADYKTDSLSEGESLENRVSAYAKQGAVYQRALIASLELSYTPRFELWFLDLDQIVKVPAHPA